MTSQNNVLEGFREGHLCQNVSSPFSGGVLSEAETSDRVGLGRNIPLSTLVGHVGGVATNLNENGTLHGNGRVVSPEQKIQTPIMNIEMDYEEEENIQEMEEWIKEKLCEYIPPAPRYLIITDMGSNKFSKEPNVFT